jgi:transcriptional regulator with XRE-family HTH domain
MDKKFRTRQEIANLIGISSKTFCSYYTGHCQIANPATRKKLLELTGIESFRSEKPNRQEGILLGDWVDSVVLRKGGTDKKKTETLPEHVETMTKTPDNLSNVSRPFLDMASELRNWFNNQNRWTTQKEFAEYLGIPRSTMKKIFQGIREPKDTFKQKLYEITQLASFKDTEQKIEVQKLTTKTERKPEHAIEQSIDNSVDKIKKHIEEILKEVELLNEKKIIKRVDVSSNDDVENLVNLFYLLARALEPFKHGTPEQRKNVRTKIPAQDLGYVMSFLKAMYDEDNFTDFMFFSEYKLKGDKNE